MNTVSATRRILGRGFFTDVPRSRARLQDFGDQQVLETGMLISIYVYLEMYAAGLRALPAPLRLDAPAPAARALAGALQRHRADGDPWRRAVQRLAPPR